MTETRTRPIHAAFTSATPRSAVSLPIDVHPATHAMPPPAEGATCCRVTNTAPHAAWLTFAADAPLGSGVHGCLEIRPGTSTLFSGHPGVLSVAAAHGDPLVHHGQDGAHLRAQGQLST